MKKLTTLLSLIILFSCSTDDIITDYTVANEKEIQTYLEDNNLNAQMNASGLYYIINNEGTGTRPSSTDNVTVAYKGYFTNGNVFDESDENGISFNLNQVIPGWTEGIQLFKEGGNGVLIIPSRLAYGNSGRPGIPGGSVLIFDVNLISVNE